MRWTMAMPRPLPLAKDPRNGWNIASSSDSEVPMPSSCTARSTSAAFGAVRAFRMRRPPSGGARDAGGKFAERGVQLLHVPVAFELLDAGHALEREEESGAAARRHELRGAQSELDRAAVARLIAEFRAAAQRLLEIQLEARG